MRDIRGAGGSVPVVFRPSQRLVIAGLAAGGVLLPAACSSDLGSSGVAGTARVTYKVGGTATSADLTMQTQSGSSQQNGVAVPLRAQSGDEGLTFVVSHGAFVYVAAQNTGESGTITCEIDVDGLPIASNESSGGFAIAQCSGRAP